MKNGNTITPDQKQQLVSRILETLQGIHYGSIEITIHDSRVVQIERKERLRFDAERRLQ